MKSRFEFKDGKSNKFWEYETGEDIDGVKVTWGRIGTAGQSQFVDMDTARKRAMEKLAKGYVKVTADRSEAKRERARQVEKEIEKDIEAPSEDMWDELIRNIKAK